MNFDKNLMCFLFLGVLVFVGLISYPIYSFFQYQKTIELIMSCRMKVDSKQDIDKVCGKIPDYKDFAFQK